MIKTKNQMSEDRLGVDEIFRFECKPDLGCFNSCCRDKHLPLWPYDVLRLRRALNLSSADLLERFAELDFDPFSGWPVLRLRLDNQGRCPFVTHRGCRVYADRPAACRLYPLTRAAAPREGRLPDVIYYRQKTQNCLGWDQDREHKCEAWNRDQGLLPYHQANDKLLPLLFHARRQGRLDLTPPQIHAVIAALYNLDVFKQMVIKSDFQPRPESDRLEAALGNDEDLLLLGRDFLIDKLFG